MENLIQLIVRAQTFFVNAQKDEDGHWVIIDGFLGFVCLFAAVPPLLQEKLTTFSFFIVLAVVFFLLAQHAYWKMNAQDTSDMLLAHQAAKEEAHGTEPTVDAGPNPCHDGGTTNSTSHVD